MHVAIAGHIAVGKSTLTRLLCQELGCQPAYEPLDENPFLSSFYQRDARWSFHTQTAFLSLRAAQHLDVQARDELIIQDRSIYEDAEVFASAQHALGYMSADEYATYRRLYEVLRTLLQPPALLVHLWAPVETLRQRLNLRARQIESTVTDAYLGSSTTPIAAGQMPLRCAPCWRCAPTDCTWTTTPRGGPGGAHRDGRPG